MPQPTINDLSDKLDKIYLAVAGDEKLGIKGTNQRLADTQSTVNDHGLRISVLEDDNKKKKWLTWVKGIGVGFGSGVAIGSTKAGAIISKVVTALVTGAGTTLFILYIIMTLK